MSWFRVDDSITFHKKTLKAKNDAMGAWVRFGSWCSAHLTDGHIPAETADLIATPDQLERLIVAGFLVRNGDDYELHDFLDYNPTAESVKEERSKKSDAKARSGTLGGIASGIARRAGAKQKEPPTRSRSHTRSHTPPDPTLFEEEGEDGVLSEGLGDGIVARATELLHELNVARMKAIPDSRRFAPISSNLTLIAARLKEGYGDDDVRHVIGVCMQEVAANPEAERWFNQVTPFRPENFRRKLGMTLRAAARPPAPNGPPVPHRDRRPSDVEREEQAHRERMRREREPAGGEG